MKVLLTGATGFIGSHVARHLVRSGHTVHAIIRPASNRWRIRDVEASLAVIESDLADPASLRSALSSVHPDLCMHLAWRGQLGAPAAQNVSSVSESLGFIKLIAEIECRRVMMTGTCFEYELGPEPLSEDSPAKPRDLYGASKHALFLIAGHLARLMKVELVWPRLFYVYGPFEDRHRLVPSIVLALLRNEIAKATRGEQVRDYLHVQDVAEALVQIAEKGITGPVNVASGTSVSIGEIALSIGRLLGKPESVKLGALPYREAEPMVIRAETRRLRGEVGWSPRIDLLDGLAGTIEWWKQQGDVSERGVSEMRERGFGS